MTIESLNSSFGILTFTVKEVAFFDDFDNQVETKALNRAMKRNIDRFPEDFCFQLSKEEYENLKCQFGTSSLNEGGNMNGYGGRRKLPYVFTEQGISMLSAVLHSETAVKVSIGIRRAFVEMRKFLTNNSLMFEKINEIEVSVSLLA